MANGRFGRELTFTVVHWNGVKWSAAADLPVVPDRNSAARNLPFVQMVGGGDWN